jgi:subtilisin
MFSQIRRQASSAQPASQAAGPRRNRAGAAPPDKKPWHRKFLAASAALALAVGTGVAAAVPAAAEPQQEYIVVLQDGVDPAAAASSQQGSYGLAVSTVYRNAVNGYAATMSASEAARLATAPGVDFITAARTFEQPLTPQPGAQLSPYWWLRIGGSAPEEVRTQASGSHVDVNVAVIDSGIDGTHPDLNVRGGVDCSTGSPVAVTPTDKVGHGTFVAGVIGAKDNNFGVIGTAPGAPLWSVRVVNDAGIITEGMLICAIDWVTSTRKDSDPDNDIQVANISIGGSGTDSADCGKGTDPMHYAICRSVSAGVVYAVAAGNSSADFATTVPATYDEVLTATAMADFDGKSEALASPLCGAEDWSLRGQLDDHPAVFSNFASQAKDKAHTVAAPGLCMSSTAPGGYAVAHGTSFASPAVAGSVALCISHNECSGSGEAVMSHFLDLTKSYNTKNHDFGFDGDPLRAVDGKYYGYLAEIANL